MNKRKQTFLGYRNFVRCKYLRNRTFILRREIKVKDHRAEYKQLLGKYAPSKFHECYRIGPRMNLHMLRKYPDHHPIKMYVNGKGSKHYNPVNIKLRTF